MRKVYLSLAGFAMLCRLNTYAQTRPDSAHVKPVYPIHSTPPVDSTHYNPHQLKLDEINFVSSYYSQTGDHSAVTGGIGTEKVTDVANGLDLNFVWQNHNNNKNTLAVGLGFDVHTSASQAFVNKSGASKADGTRVYPSLGWTVENAKTGNTFGIGTYYSNEYNYTSLGADMHFSVKTADKMGEFAAKVQSYFDHVTLIYPSEFVNGFLGTTAVVTTGKGKDGGHRDNFGTSPRNTYTGAISYTQIINSRLQVAVLADVVTQNGFLSLPFHRVFYNTGKDTIEKLPSSRFKLPLGFRLNYFAGDNIILRSYYRYYLDNWGIRSNTANLEVAFKLSPSFSLSPFYRFYSQTASTYFAPYEVHKVTDQYYTSNYEYAKFNSQFFGVGFRVVPTDGVFGWQNLHDLEIRYGHYTQTTSLVSDVISVNFGFK